MHVFRLCALTSAAVMLVGSPVLAQDTQSPAYPPAYQAPATTPAPATGADPNYQPVDPGYIAPADTSAPPPVPAPVDTPAPPVAPPPVSAPGQPMVATPCAPVSGAAANGQAGVHQEDALAAAEGVFGKGAKGLASLIEKVFKDRGQPNAYIAGREAGGALIVGVRYGSGTMCHTIEGNRRVFWTGPSVGFDAGADANKVFVLVYNLQDSQELFRRYPTTEGHAYFIGGFSASVLKRGDVVLVPIRLGVGLRLGVNGGYMSFSEKSRLLPF